MLLLMMVSNRKHASMIAVGDFYVSFDTDKKPKLDQDELTEIPWLGLGLSITDAASHEYKMVSDPSSDG